MVNVNICGWTYGLDELKQDMIHDQFRNRERAGTPFWYSVSIDIDDIHLSFSSNRFPNRGFACGRRLTRREERIVDFWRNADAANDSSPRGLLEFLNQLSNAV